MALNHSIEEFVPHSGNMSLLDRIISYDDESLTAEVTISQDNIFSQPNGMPATVGIELMAQTIAAFAGVKAREQGRDVEIGFLVGTRKYESNIPIFPIGCTLSINATRELQAENGLGVFACSISADNIYASANINVFQPSDVEEFLNNELSDC
jgi:predicted hotdog family 3-hydroxylacyl-ACP dehydratase